MPKDLSRILEDWPYQPDQVTVRIVTGDDGREKVQLRVDLGVLQMELEGRPDGRRPQSCPSWLDYYQQKQRTHDADHPDSDAFTLDEEDCIRLWREGVQYYHRHLSFWHLELYDLCARDTARNLRLFAFVCRHAVDDRHKQQFDQWRPYVTMMHARAVATPLLAQEQYAKGLRAIESGIDGIQDFLDEHGLSERGEECVELVGLQRWRDEILDSDQYLRATQPDGAVEILRRKLEAAISAEQFEEAARLRDKIRDINAQC